ncbi:hypothetical protein VPH35_063918 [Triticum aestivum]
MAPGPHLGQVYQKSHVAKNSRRIHQSCPIPSGPITSPEPETKPRERSIQAGVTRRRLDSSRRRDNQPLIGSIFLSEPIVRTGEKGIGRRSDNLDYPSVSQKRLRL